MSVEEYMTESIILECQDTDIAVTTCSGKMAARLRRRPSHDVDRGGVQGKLVDALPLGVLLAPDQDAAVVGGGCEDGAVFGVRPGDAPDGSFVAGTMLV